MRGLDVAFGRSARVLTVLRVRFLRIRGGFFRPAVPEDPARIHVRRHEGTQGQMTVGPQADELAE